MIYGMKNVWNDDIIYEMMICDMIKRCVRDDDMTYEMMI